MDEAASVFEGPLLLDRDRTLGTLSMLHCEHTKIHTLLHSALNSECRSWLKLAGCLGDPMPPSILATHPLHPLLFVFVFFYLHFCIWNFGFILLTPSATTGCDDFNETFPKLKMLSITPSSPKASLLSWNLPFQYKSDA